MGGVLVILEKEDNLVMFVESLGVSFGPIDDTMLPTKTEVNKATDLETDFLVCARTSTGVVLGRLQWLDAQIKIWTQLRSW